MDEGPEERNLAGVDEVAVADGPLKARLRGDVSSDQRVDGVDAEVPTILEETEQGPDAIRRIGRVDSTEDGNRVVDR